MEDVALGTCVTDDELLVLGEGRLPEKELERLLEHADGCAACRELLAGVGRSASLRTGSEPAPLLRGASVGRYIVTDFIGAGAMGEVHAAYDPELNRKVALKLLRPGGESQRLLREAQVMARL